MWSIKIVRQLGTGLRAMPHCVKGAENEKQLTLQCFYKEKKAQQNIKTFFFSVRLSLICGFAHFSGALES